jgi:SecD/SecF fusion protein
VPRLPRATFSQIVNRSMSEVLTRSLITGLSSVFLVGVLMIFGGTTLQDFAFAMLIGIASGTYSSIFIASPVLTAWKEREPAYRRRRERIEEQMGYVPAFPEENVIAKLEGHADAEQQRTEPGARPVPQAPVAERAPEQPQPQRSPVPGVVPERPAPVAPPPEVAPDRGGEPEPAPGERVEPPAPAPAGDGTEGDDAGLADKKSELSEASAAALRRARERQQKGGRRKRKHGRPR